MAFSARGHLRLFCSRFRVPFSSLYPRRPILSSERACWFEHWSPGWKILHLRSLDSGHLLMRDSNQSINTDGMPPNQRHLWSQAESEIYSLEILILIETWRFKPVPETSTMLRGGSPTPTAHPCRAGWYPQICIYFSYSSLTLSNILMTMWVFPQFPANHCHPHYPTLIMMSSCCLGNPYNFNSHLWKIMLKNQVSRTK